MEITGVGFFDFEHRQSGVAPNAIELHPMLDIRRIDSKTTMTCARQSDLHPLPAARQP
jgi:hypothetical protein